LPVPDFLELDLTVAQVFSWLRPGQQGENSWVGWADEDAIASIIKSVEGDTLTHEGREDAKGFAAVMQRDRLSARVR
jgi:hypothetical protein